MLNLYENEVYADALSKGELFTLISLVKKGILNPANAAEELNISEESFMSKMKEVEMLPQS